ncbi:MAG: hypothetical protein N2749_06070 [Clostridia bacterium]|nr:hypothetical protein [Clostridia bacterium]
MNTILTTEQFLILTYNLLQNEFPDIEYSISDYCFYNIYEDLVKIISEKYDIKIISENISFDARLYLVTLFINNLKNSNTIESFLKQLQNDILNNSCLMNEFKKSFSAITDIIFLSSINCNFNLSIMLLTLAEEVFLTIPHTLYSRAIKDFSKILESLSSYVQKKLYNDNSKFFNWPVTLFTLESLQTDKSKFKSTEVYLKLNDKYPDILETYEKSLFILEKLKIRKSIIL